MSVLPRFLSPYLSYENLALHNFETCQACYQRREFGSRAKDLKLLAKDERLCANQMFINR